MKLCSFAIYSWYVGFVVALSSCVGDAGLTGADVHWIGTGDPTLGQGSK